MAIDPAAAMMARLDALEAQQQELAARQTVYGLDRKLAVVREAQLILAGARHPYDVAVGIGDVSKVMAKGALVVASKAAAAAAAKGVGTTAGKTLAKVIPGVSLVFGLGMAITRYFRGDHWTAITAEVVSGIAGCFPGIGTGISLVTDGILICVDLSGVDAPPTVDPVAGAIPDLNTAYQALGIQIVPGFAPTREEVDRQYRLISRQIHPDRLQAVGGTAPLDFGQLMATLNRAKDIVYAARGWVAAVG